MLERSSKYNIIPYFVFQMVICDDKGDIRVWIKGLIWSEISGTGNEQDTWSNTAGASDHDSAILAIDLFPGEENVAVTGGADNCIKVNHFSIFCWLLSWRIQTNTLFVTITLVC